MPSRSSWKKRQSAIIRQVTLDVAVLVDGAPLMNQLLAETVSQCLEDPLVSIRDKSDSLYDELYASKGV